MTALYLIADIRGFAIHYVLPAMPCRFIILLKCFLFWLCPVLLRAAEITAGPTVTTSATSAVIRWTTDVECGTVVKFGTDPDHLNHREEGALGKIHEVTLASLTNGQTYYFAVGTAKRTLKTGQFTAGRSGTPAPDSPAPRPTAPETRPSPPTSPPSTPPPPASPPAKVTWGDLSSLRDHYVRHGRDFGATSPEDYARKAWEFYQRAIDESLPARLDEDGVLRVYDPRTRAFAAYNRNGTTRTYFKPGSPDYFQRQPGKPVKLRRPPPSGQ